MRYIFALFFAVSLALGQQLDLKSQSRNADFSTHAFIKPWVIGTSLPATCSVGDAFFDSDATAGQNVYVCTATNTWTLSSGAISGLTASRALQSDGSGNVAVSSVTSTELGYLSGVTSAVQTQLNAKQATITGAATTITGSDLTASRAVIANASGKIAVSAVTDTELGYVSGVTSALQTQLNAKLSSTPPGSSGQFIYNNAGAFGAKAIADGDLPSTLADKTLTGPLITASLVANLPSAASNTAKLYVVIDGTAVGDCTTGGGSAATLCRSNGSAWVAFGDGNSGGGGLSPPASSGMLYGTTGGTTTGRTITASTGITVTNGDGASGNPTVAADTAVMLGRARNQTGGDLRCVPASASGANYTCAMTPTLTAYTDGMVVEFEPDVASSSGAVTLNIDSLGSVNVKQSDGTTDPGASALVAGRQVPLRYDGSVWRMGVVGSGGGGMGDPGANGMMARTALNTTTARTITGTANEITVSNGDGVSGNPTFALSSTLDLSGKTSTKPSKTGTTPPATCAVGETFIDTDAAATSQWLVCTATNTWTAQGGGGTTYITPTVYASRPAASSVVAGTVFAATDMAWKTWVSTGSAWSARFLGHPVTEPAMSGWTKVNGPTVTDAKGTSEFSVTSSSATQLFTALTSLPSAPYTITAEFVMTSPFTAASVDTRCGIVFTNGTTTSAKSYLYGVGKKAGAMDVFRLGYFATYTGSDTSIVGTDSAPLIMPSVRLRVKKTVGGDREFYWWSGQDWKLHTTRSSGLDLTETNVGFGCLVGNSYSLTATVVDWTVE